MRDEGAAAPLTEALAELESSPTDSFAGEMEQTLAHFAVLADLCIGCGLCHERAPENIDVPSGSMVAVVMRQPADADEEAALGEAAEYCPTGGLVRH